LQAEPDLETGCRIAQPETVGLDVAAALRRVKRLGGESGVEMERGLEIGCFAADGVPAVELGNITAAQLERIKGAAAVVAPARSLPLDKEFAIGGHGGAECQQYCYINQILKNCHSAFRA